MYSKYVAGISLSPDQALFFAMRKHWAGSKLMNVRIGERACTEHLLFQLLTSKGEMFLPGSFQSLSKYIY